MIRTWVQWRWQQGLGWQQGRVWHDQLPEPQALWLAQWNLGLTPWQNPHTLTPHAHIR